LKVAPSLQEYFCQLIYLIKKNILQKRKDGKITKFFDIENIMNKFIENIDET
jgi:hypothetical protein